MAQLGMYKNIPVAQLRVGMYLAKLDTNWLDHPFWRKSFLIEDQETISTVLDLAIESAWIDTSKGLDVEATHAEQLAPESDANAPPAEKSAAEPAITPAPVGVQDMALAMDRAKRLCAAAREEVTAMFQDARMGRAISMHTVGPLVAAIAASVNENSAAILSVARIKTHDEYTYMHSVAVCALMVSLARVLGLDESQAREAGTAGLMHDLGKAVMPIEILNKPGSLSDDEYGVMRSHPVEGHRLLVESGASDATTLEVALHHHEKIDGTGYPHRLAGNSITHWARMAAVCDVYDAVTSNRPYKSGWDPAQSIQRMFSWQGHFDASIMRAFVKSIGIYPVGSLVRMKSGKLAVVIEPGKGSLVKPKVRIFFSTRTNEPVALDVIDLENPRCHDAIAGPEDPAKWDFTHLNRLWAIG